MLDWSDEQRDFRLALRRFAESEVAPHREELEHGTTPPYEILRKMMQVFGLDELAEERYRRSLDVSSDAGPRRRNSDDLAAVLLPMIELSRHSPGMVTAMGVSVNLTPGAIMKRGTSEQKERWALDLLTLRTVGAWAITEPGSGSDAFGGMRATARREGDGFVLNGNKTFITNGPFADVIVYICKLDEGGATERPTIVNFVLERGMAGLEQSRPLRKMGLHSSPTGELYLSDCYVGMDRLLGGPAQLTAIHSHAPRPSTTATRSPAKGAFASERASIAATALGIIERCLELSVTHARDRVQFGKAIGQFQLIQEKLARMEIARLNLTNLLCFYVESLTTGRGVTLAEASAMKLYAARATVEVTNDAIQIFGGSGYMADYVVEQLARDARVLQIYAGTDEMQIVSIAKALLSQDAAR
jgi:acyl-CoA dehydrogenase